MKIAITTLRKRIELLNKEYEEVEEAMADTEIRFDYVFYMNDLLNIKKKRIELEHAITILQHYKVMKFNALKTKNDI